MKRSLQARQDLLLVDAEEGQAAGRPSDLLVDHGPDPAMHVSGNCRVALPRRVFFGIQVRFTC